MFDKDIVNQAVKQSNNKIALIGYRKKGKEIYKYLKTENVDVVYIIERNYEALRVLEKDMSVPIVGFDENADFYKKADILLWTGDTDLELINECLTLANIKIPVFKAI